MVAIAVVAVAVVEIAVVAFEVGKKTRTHNLKGSTGDSSRMGACNRAGLDSDVSWCTEDKKPVERGEYFCKYHRIYRFHP